MGDEPFSEGVNEVKRVETFAAAKGRFTEAEAKSIKEVLADEDFVVHVRTEFGGRTRQLSLLVKVKDGKPRLAGWGRAAEVPGQ